MTREALLEQLREETYVMLKPSGIHGIGVFAIRPIPKGCDKIFSSGVGDWIKLPIADVEQLPAHSKELIETYCLFDEAHYYVPDYGFKVMDIVNYLNHSNTPNIISVNDGETFQALRDIAVGEELFVNYGHIVDGMEDYQ
ncbi:MAG: SET domain-containing protein-lysine N-methyltransferase [Chitinophagaceae bacterium]